MGLFWESEIKRGLCLDCGVENDVMEVIQLNFLRVCMSNYDEKNLCC